VKKYTIDLAPGGLEARMIGPDGFQGPWRSTEYFGRLQIESDIRKRRLSLMIGNTLGGCLVIVGIAWLAALAALGVWIVFRVTQTF